MDKNEFPKTYTQTRNMTSNTSLLSCEYLKISTVDYLKLTKKNPCFPTL